MNEPARIEEDADWKTAALAFAVNIEKLLRGGECGQVQNIPAAEYFRGSAQGRNACVVMRAKAVDRREAAAPPSISYARGEGTRPRSAL